MSLDKEGPSSGLGEPARESGSGWEPEDFLAPYAAETFEVEKHATQILQAGNINEEVGSLASKRFFFYNTLIDQIVYGIYFRSLDSFFFREIGGTSLKGTRWIFFWKAEVYSVLYVHVPLVFGCLVEEKNK
jgi:hypothetical protein